MKRNVLVWMLSLAVAFGLALGQDGADQPADTAGSTQEQTQDASDTTTQPADSAGEQTEGTNDSAQPADPATDGDATQPADPATGDDETQPADPATEPEQEQPATDPADMQDTAAQDDAQAGQSLIDALRSNPDFSMFANAVERAGLSETLDQEGPFTILAPTNQAFEQAGFNLDDLSQDQLTTLVRNHIISGMVAADQLGTLAGVVTLLGNEYAVTPGTDQPIAGGETDGEVAGGGQAQPADPADAEGAEDPATVPAEPAEQPADVEREDAAQDGPAEDDPEGDATDGAEEPGDVATGGDAQDAADGDRPTGELDSSGTTNFTIGEANVTHAGIETEGGVVYGINTLLVPQDFNLEGVEGGGAAQPATDTEDMGTEDMGTEGAEGAEAGPEGDVGADVDTEGDAATDIQDTDTQDGAATDTDMGTDGADDAEAGPEGDVGADVSTEGDAATDTQDGGDNGTEDTGTDGTNNTNDTDNTQEGTTDY